MSKFDYIAFDLDGTLTDPAKGLVQGFIYAFRKMGIEYDSPDSLRKYIGPPLLESWKNELGLSYEEAERMVLIFREYYNVYGWWDNMLYDGIEELLSGLKQSGKKLLVATSKPEDTAKRVLSLFGIDKYFDFIGGADGHKNRDKKWEVLEYSLRSVGVEPSSPLKDRCILVGDRMYDAEGAGKCGIASLGISWGHGDPEELKAAGFDYLLNTPREVLDFLK